MYIDCIMCSAESSSLLVLYTTTEHVNAVVQDNNDTQCNTILLDNIVGLLINTNYKPVLL